MKQIVIGISDDDYNRIFCNRVIGSYSINDLWLLTDCVVNGVLLPANHGRLIDADAFERRCMFDRNIEDMQDVIYALRDYPEIIEAKEGERDADSN